MNAPAAPSSDSHEVTFTLLERDAWALLRAFDDRRAFSTVAGRPRCLPQPGVRPIPHVDATRTQTPPFVSACLALGRQQTIILSREGVRILADFLPVSAFASEEEAHDVAREIARHIREARGNHVERQVACA